MKPLASCVLASVCLACGSSTDHAPPSPRLMAGSSRPTISVWHRHLERAAFEEFTEVTDELATESPESATFVVAAVRPELVTVPPMTS